MVTGGNGGIGLGIARGLARSGANIVIGARNAAKTEEAVRDISSLGVEAVGATMDVLDEESVSDGVSAAVSRFGGIDILVNNAGIGIRKPPQDYSLEEWQQVVGINLDGTFLCSREVYPHMKRRGRRQNNQHRLNDIGLRIRLGGGVLGEQRWSSPTDEEPRGRVGLGQHTGERDTAGMDTYRSYRADSESVHRTLRVHQVPDSAWSMGRAGRNGRSGCLSVERRVGLCHGSVTAGGRGLHFVLRSSRQATRGLCLIRKSRAGGLRFRPPQPELC